MYISLFLKIFSNFKIVRKKWALNFYNLSQNIHLQIRSGFSKYTALPKKIKVVLLKYNLNSAEAVDRIAVQFSMDQKSKRENGNTMGTGYKNISWDK